LFGPEAAGSIDFAVVEAIARQVGFGMDDGREMPGGGVEKDEARARSGDQTALAAQTEGTGHFGHGPACRGIAAGVEALYPLAFHIHPVERLLAHAPDRTFTDQIGCRHRDAQPIDCRWRGCVQRRRSNSD
jgi:hypothetical protein